MTTWGVILVLVLGGGMLALMELGRYLGRRRSTRDTEGARAGLGAVEGAVFALIGLLFAFTFSGAASRLDQRRLQIVDEANAWGTAWLRFDMLPKEAQPGVRDAFRRYVDERLMIYRSLPDMEAAMAAMARAEALQQEVWSRAVAVCQTEAGQRASMLVLPALNQAFDIASTRTAMGRMHPPVVIYGMLAVLVLVGALMAGFGMAGGRNRSWIHVIAFAVIMAATVFVILDLEYPRLGFIRLDAFDELLVQVRQGMK